ncbi:hypothetical protein [Streptomyces sp. NPDC127072]|uniref:hypothetical protein n=1 Tax=Streptomyces sp. NPDC127072 TaxID=3347129 RepID=UPI003657CC29
MLLSAIVADPSDATLIATGVTSFVAGGVGAFTVTHHRKMFAWIKKVNSRDEEAVELGVPEKALDLLFTEVCRLSNTPAYVADLVEVTRIANEIKGRIANTEDIRPELEKVVGCAKDYVATALPELPTTVRMPVADMRAHLVQAMKQESARTALECAINAAEQRINTLRRI